MANNILFKEFCDRHNISYEKMLGNVPAWQNEVDSYSVEGEGDIYGVEVQKYGEFGNNVMQLLHAIYVARRLKLKWVSASKFGNMFLPGEYTFTDGLKLLIDQPKEKKFGASVIGKYFFWWGTSGLIKEMQPDVAVRIARENILPIIDLPSLGSESLNDRIHVHIRGGSDIFGDDAKLLGQLGKLNVHYVQPPLAYYKLIISEYFAREPCGRVEIISIDRSNPCIEYLEKWINEIGREFTFKSGTLKDDIASLYKSNEIIAGWGTFIPMIALLSKYVKKIYYFRDRQQAEKLQASGIDIVVVKDRCNKYMKRGQWSNSPDQREFMVTYPIECLEYVND